MKNRTFLLLAAAMTVICLLCVTCLRIVYTSGPSMEPTYTPGDILLCIRAFRPAKTGDVVLVEKNGKLLIKRIAATQGQTATLEALPSGYEETVQDGVAVKTPIYKEGRDDIAGRNVVYQTQSNWFNIAHTPSASTYWCTYYYWGSYEHPQIPEGFVFVAGDNLQNSDDSRRESFGLVSTDAIWGYVLLTIKDCG